MAASFEAWEYREDGGFDRARLSFQGSAEAGWQVARNGRPHLAIGPGHVLLRVRSCGICATDLARRFLPFPLPQVIGHEVLAEDAAGRRCVVEINASCRARRVRRCARCRAGLDHHCPDRRVLGIHDLPGGFGPFVLAPVGAVHPVPAALSDETAVLVEPFAAALHAVTDAGWRAGDRVAVLGPRRLGMLLIAALDAERRRTRRDVEIVAVVRRPGLAELARALGADAVEVLPDDVLPRDFADVVFDTTGTPRGLVSAVSGARREVHLKSTHGQPAGGLRHATELVVDELGLGPLPDGPLEPPAAWLAASPAPPEALVGSAAELVARCGTLGARAAVVASAAQADAAIRPEPGRQHSLLRPGGRLLVHPAAASEEALLLREIARRGLVVSTSRCGAFGPALERLSADPALSGLGARLVTHRLPPSDLPAAFAAAASREALKVVVEHAPGS